VDGWGKAIDAAMVVQVIVAFPVSDAELNVIVFGALKFRSGEPKLQVGASAAPAGVVVTEVVRVTVPAKPFDPVTVMRHEPDWPGAAIVIVVEQPDGGLIPGEPTVTVTPVAVVDPV